MLRQKLTETILIILGVISVCVVLNFLAFELIDIFVKVFLTNSFRFIGSIIHR